MARPTLEQQAERAAGEAWRKAVTDHAYHTMHGAITHAAGDLIANARPGPLVDGRPSIEIQGPDGEWRAYIVRLTEAPVHAPLDPAHLGAMRP